MCNILHIAGDGKFVDLTFERFEEVNPGKNKFLIFSGAASLSSIRKTPFSTFSRRSILGRDFTRSLLKYDMVIIHNMHDYKLQLLARTTEVIRFVWIGYGGDYYGLITHGNFSELLKPKTKLLYDQKTKSVRRLIMNRTKQFVKKAVLGYEDVNAIEVINNKILYFSPVTYEEYELVKKSNPDFQPQYISWNIGTTEDDLIKDIKDKVASEGNILLGNSATYENNHLEAFDLIKELKLDGRKIITPLSYGDGGAFYRETIMSYGKHFFGRNFVPLIDFLPLEQYMELIVSCTVCIMCHLRQQAAGNIYTMLYIGAKVFLDIKNPLYTCFKKLGISIFPLEDLREEIDTKLTMAEIAKNREILVNNWGREAIYNKTKNLIHTVMSSPIKRQ